MGTNQIISCDICNKHLQDNEIEISHGFMGQSSKKISKSSLQFKFDGSLKKGELCFKCAKQFRDYLEKLKEEKIK